MVEVNKNVQCQNALQKLFGFPNEEKVVIAVPEWIAIAQRTQQKNLLAWEDMLAAYLVVRSLIFAGWHEKNIEIKFIEQFNQNDLILLENLVLLCSPERNPITKNALSILCKKNKFSCTFEEDNANPKQWFWRIEGKKFKSKSYKESIKIEKKFENCNPYATPEPLHDKALIARFVNPWQNSKKVIMLAGIRSFGTWGAAHALREMPQELYYQTNEKDFATIIRCTLKAWKITRCDLKENFEINKL